MKDIYHADTSKIPADDYVFIDQDTNFPKVVFYYFKHPDIEEPLHMLTSVQNRHFETLGEFFATIKLCRKALSDIDGWIVEYCMEHNRLPTPKEIDKWKVQEALK